MNSQGEIKNLDQFFNELENEEQNLKSLMAIPADLTKGEQNLLEKIQRVGKGEDVIPINDADLTKKQRKAGRVSIHDHRSKAGKELTNFRSLQRKMNENRH